MRFVFLIHPKNVQTLAISFSQDVFTTSAMFQKLNKTAIFQHKREVKLLIEVLTSEALLYNLRITTSPGSKTFRNTKGSESTVRRLECMHEYRSVRCFNAPPKLFFFIIVETTSADTDILLCSFKVLLNCNELFCECEKKC